MAEDEKPTETVDEDNIQNADTEPAETDTFQEEQADDPAPEENIKPPKKSNPFRRFWGWYKTHKKLAIPLTVVVLLAILMVVPLTRYDILGLVLKRDIQLKITDIQTFAPISGVDVSAGGQSATTDGQGLATLKRVKVGKTTLKATKKYYKDFSQPLMVTVRKVKGVGEFRMEATGRVVPITVINKVNGKPVADATIKAGDSEAKTDKNGTTNLVLPPNQTETQASLSADGYNTQSVKIEVSPANFSKDNFTLTPSGKLYFLSKQSGKIDVVKTDLDGTNRQTVVAGTGQEEDGNTILLASRDWKYLALLSRRENNTSRLYLIDTNGDKMTEIDSGDATFTMVGWDDHFFVYQVNRNNVPVWQPKSAALKTFNADNLQLATMDETNAEGSGTGDYVSEYIANVYILSDRIIYTKNWSGGYYSNYRLAGKRTGIYSVKPNGGSKQTLKDFDAASNGYLTAVLSEPKEVYFSTYSSAANTSYYEYQNGAVKESKDLNSDTFNKSYPTFLQSPSGQATFWYESRDGKNTLFIGTAEGDNPKEVASLSEYTPYGWYTDDYLLVSKSGSELYVMPVGGPGDKNTVLKVTDYHKPQYSFRGYGGGYGGF